MLSYGHNIGVLLHTWLCFGVEPVLNFHVMSCGKDVPELNCLPMLNVLYVFYVLLLFLHTYILQLHYISWTM